jgi:hypothetical protein
MLVRPEANNVFVGADVGDVVGDAVVGDAVGCVHLVLTVPPPIIPTHVLQMDVPLSF